MSKTWLSGLLRARQAQEDLAAQDLAAAERRARRAAERVKYNRDRLDSLRIADAVYAAPAFVAAAVALQSAAATHAAALELARLSGQDEDARRAVLGDAARARRSAEELHDRHVAEVEHTARRVAQAELDEIAARIARGSSAADGSTP